MMSLLLMCGLLTAATPSLPAAEDADVRAALARYEALEYGEVIPLLERALARPALAAGDRRLALAYLGRAHAIHRQAAPAEEAFARLLEIDPSFTVPEYESPLIRAALARARDLVVAASPEADASAAQAPSPSPDPAPELAPAPSTAPDQAPAATVRATPVVTPPDNDDPDDASPTALWLALGGAAAGVLVLGGATTLLLLEPWTAPALPSGSMGRWELP